MPTKRYRPDIQNIYPSSEIGDDCVIAAFVEIGKDVKIGNGCHIGAFCFIPEGVEIGNNVFIGPGTIFANDKYPPSHGQWKNGPQTIVEDDVVIGAGARILPGVRLHKGCFIAMGALVTKDVNENMTVMGVPACAFRIDR